MVLEFLFVAKIVMMVMVGAVFSLEFDMVSREKGLGFTCFSWEDLECSYKDSEDRPLPWFLKVLKGMWAVSLGF